VAGSAQEITFKIKATDEASAVFKRAGDAAEAASKKAMAGMTGGGSGSASGGAAGPGFSPLRVAAGVAVGLAAANQVAALAESVRGFRAAERDALTTGSSLSERIADLVPGVGKVALGISDWAAGFDRAGEKSKELSGQILKDLAVRRRAIEADTELIGLGGLEAQKRAIEIATEARRKALAEEATGKLGGLNARDSLDVRAKFEIEDKLVRENAKARTAEAERVWNRERELADLSFKTELARVHQLADLRIKSLQADNQITALRDAGQGATADRAAAAKAAADAENETRKTAFEAIAQKPGDVLSTFKDAALQIRGIREKGSADDERGAQAEEAFRRERAERIKALDVSVAADRLRVRGQFEDAALLELKDATDREVAAIEQAERTKLEAAKRIKDQGQREQAERDAKSEAAAATTSAKALAASQATALERDKRFRLTDSASELRARGVAVDVAGLQQRGQFGDGKAVLEAQRKQIAEEFKQKQEDVDRRLRDPSLTAEQREGLKRERIKLGTQEKIAQGLAANQPGSPLARTPIIEGGFLTGAGQNLRENLEASVAARQVKVLEEIKKKAEAAEKIQLDMLAAMEAVSDVLSYFTPGRAVR
jgi:hypothetical protein